MRNKLKTYLLFAVLTITFFSCRKDTPPVLQQQGNISLSTSKRLLICDEGNYGQNNGAISVYDPSSNALIVSAFSGNNPGYTLGDVVQSIAKFNKKYYVVVNNSGKIVVCDNNLVKLTAIGGFISPRYIEFVSNDKAYVTNLQLNTALPNYIQVVDLNTNSISKTIRIDGWAEEMEQSYGKVYVTNQSKKYVYIINTANDKVDSVFVGATNACIVKDINEKIWVSCNSDSTTHTSAKLKRINPAVDTVDLTIDLQSNNNAISRLCINGSGSTLYYLMDNVFKLDVASLTNTSSLIISQGTHNFYGLCIDPDDETIYMSDAVDYNSNGKLLRYQPNGTLTNTYTVGLIPGYMLMD